MAAPSCSASIAIFMPPRRQRRCRSGDPFADIVYRLQKQNRGQRRLCDCVNDAHNVCEHIWALALAQLAKTDSDPADDDSFHDSAPATRPTNARHGTPEREHDLWLRIKAGQDTHHPDDRRPDEEGGGA